jgi:competence protein ComEC
VQGAAVSFWAASVGLLAGAWLLAPVPWRWKLVALPAMLPLLWPTSMSQILSGPPEGELQVMAVDIGQGTAVLVRTARHALLYDTGPRLSPETDAGQRVLVGLLAAVGVRQLDEMMISHGDMDHIGGAASVLRAVPVARLRTSLAADHELLHTPVPHGSPPPHTPCQAGQRWVWEGVHFEVLHPTEDDLAAREHLSDNAVSCVLRIEAHGRRVLLTGDIEADQEAALLSRDPQALASEVLVVPHHGSKTSSTPAFLRAVHPQVAVIQAGARNRYGHPHASVVERYRFLGITLEMTPDCGAWVWQSNAAPSATEPGWCWRDRSPRYWQGHHAPALPVPTV